MAINWGMNQGNNALAYFQLGQQLGQQVIDRRVGDATARILTGGQQAPGQPPVAPGGMTPGIGDQVNRDMGKDWATVARHNPQAFLRLREQEAEQARAQQAQAQKQAATMRQLLEEAGNDPMRAMTAAQQLGIDTRGIPQPGTPEFEPWRQNQLFILKAIETPDGQKELSGIARELLNAGYEQGTPEFEEAMRSVINNKYAAEYVDEQGNTRRRSALNLTGPAPMPQAVPQVQAQEPITFDMYMSAAQGLGPQGSIDWIRQNNIPVRVRSPQEARRLPSGTRLVLPDGTEGVVP